MSSSFNSVLTAIVAGSITLCSIVTEDNANAAEPIQFNKDIRPILSDRCFPCHGPDENQRESGLRLDEREAAMQAADSGQAAIVPHDADASELVRRVFSADEEAMPPAEFNKPLSNEEKQLLRRWIDEGADYQRHWAFAPPKHAAVPQVLDSSWPRNAVDYFILERMESAGLAPSPPADWLTLLRRLSLDITGLPPAPTEVEQFQRELANVSSRAEEDLLVARWVDRLLASPHFGERMAVDWLDAARFADTNGYQVDRDREMYAWRDWVINAFNANQPFDQFTIEQLAGDLLPEPTLSQRIATGFHRNHMLNEEGGIIPEEFLAEYCSDRVETTATVWLGQTFNCCRCHDHKFDAFTQKDYYGLYAFFHNIAEKGVGNYGASIRRNAPPMLKLPAPELEAKLQQLHEKLSQTKLQLVQLDAGFEAEQQEWESRLLASTVLWTPLRLASAKIADNELAVEEDQLAAIVSELLPGKQELEVSATVTRPGVTSVSIKLAPVSTADWTDRSLAVTNLSLSASAEHAPEEQPLAIKGIEVGPSLKREEVAKALDNDETSKTQVTLQAGGEAVLAVVIDQSPLPPPFTLRLKLSLESNESAEPWKLALATTETESDLLIPAEIERLVRANNAERTDQANQKVSAYFRDNHPERNRLEAIKQTTVDEIDATDLLIPTTLVMEEIATARETFILKRGDYRHLGEQVTATTPAILPEMPADEPRNRLGLARWLVDAGNPLTARVTVNRFWQSLFGTGLVRTADNFGAQGEAPSHAELLDWLAVEFVESGWDVKAMLRLLLTSATYRQSSRLTPTLLARDAENRLLARGPRFRLQAEFVRDQALASSGLLVDTIGGPSVRPYHPPGLYEQVVSGSSADTYQLGQGDELYRRSLYTYWKRSVPNPAMLIFDAPFREMCTVRRSRTNTPLQALNLMNDPTYVEAARCLAQRMLREGGASRTEQLEFGFRLLLVRSPRPEEIESLLATCTRMQDSFAADPESAKQLLQTGASKTDTELDPVKLASMTAVACVLLNLDETVTKE